MNLAEARTFYMQYQGRQFHMGREEPYKYQEFKNRNIPEETLRQWDDELISGIFERLWDDPSSVWWMHSSIVTKLLDAEKSASKHIPRLLDEMEKMIDLDDENRIRIIENMAGRNESRTAGGVYLVCRNSNQGSRMDNIMKRMLSRMSEEDKERYEKAADGYHTACRKYLG